MIVVVGDAAVWYSYSLLTLVTERSPMDTSPDVVAVIVLLLLVFRGDVLANALSGSTKSAN